MQVANLLIKNGADINQRDSQGQSIGDLLQDPRWESRVADLRRVLQSGAVDDARGNAAGDAPQMSVADEIEQCKANTETERQSAIGAFYWCSVVDTWRSEVSQTTYRSDGTYAMRRPDGSGAFGKWEVDDAFLRHTAVRISSPDGNLRPGLDQAWALVCVDKKMFIANSDGMTVIQRRVR